MYFVTKTVVMQPRACDSKEKFKRKTIKNEYKRLLDAEKKEAAFIIILMSASRIIKTKKWNQSIFSGCKGKFMFILLQKRKTLQTAKNICLKKSHKWFWFRINKQQKISKNQTIFVQLYKIAQKGGVTKNTNLLFLSHYCFFIIQVVKYPCNEYFGKNVPIWCG